MSDLFMFWIVVVLYGRGGFSCVDKEGLKKVDTQNKKGSHFVLGNANFGARNNNGAATRSQEGTKGGGF